LSIIIRNLKHVYGEGVKGNQKGNTDQRGSTEKNPERFGLTGH